MQVRQVSPSPYLGVEAGVELAPTEGPARPPPHPATAELVAALGGAGALGEGGHASHPPQLWGCVPTQVRRVCTHREWYNRIT